MSQDIEDNSEPLLVVEYSFGGRILALFLTSIMLFFGLLVSMSQNIFLDIFGFSIVFITLIDFFKILFFKILIFKENELEIIWDIGFKDYRKIFLYQKLFILLGIRAYAGNYLTFVNSRGKWQIPFSIDLLPVSKKDFIKIKKMIKEKNIEIGDGYEWNN